MTPSNTRIPARTNPSPEFQNMICIDESQTKDYRFHRVTEPDDLFSALKLVQDIYIQEGYVDEKQTTCACRILKNHYYEDTAVFVGKKDRDIIFTVSLFPDSPCGLPMDAIYGKELDRLRSRGRKIGEVGCLATHPDHRNGSQNILMHGNKIMFKHAMEKLGLDDLVIVVHPKHALVYKEVLLFEELNPGTVKSYPKVNNNPAVALRLDLTDIEERFRAYYRKSALENDLHHFVFVKDSFNIEISDDLNPPAIYKNNNLFFPVPKVP